MTTFSYSYSMPGFWISEMFSLVIVWLTKMILGLIKGC